MSSETPPFAEQDETVSAEVLRRAIGSSLARGSTIGSVVGGLIQTSDMVVAASSGMNVTVAPGEAWIPGTSSATQGGYYCRVSSTTTLAISTSNPSNPRIDTIVAQVQDKAYAGSTDAFAPAVITGTPTSGATLSNLSGAGAVPASSMVLAYVLVPANASSIVSGDILNVATLAVDGLGPLSYVNGSSNMTVPNLTYVNAAAGVTITLPNWPQGGFIVVTAASGVTAGNPVTVASANIYGDGLSDATSFPIGVPGVTVLLIGNGSSWHMIGQQDTGWVALTLPSGVSSSGGDTASGRIVGSRLLLKGELTNNSAGSITTWATLPSNVRPSVQRVVKLLISNVGGENVYNGNVNTGGTIVLGASTNNGTTLFLDDVACSI
jgi:hypothetical protein